MSYKEREGSRMSQNVHTEFVNKKVWEMFKKRFKSHTTEASYWSDIAEFCRFCGKKAEDTEKKDVDRYYSYMKKKAESGIISPLTVTKKFRELHSFFKFAEEEARCTGTIFTLILRIWKRKKDLQGPFR